MLHELRRRGDRAAGFPVSINPLTEIAATAFSRRREPREPRHLGLGIHEQASRLILSAESIGRRESVKGAGPQERAALRRREHAKGTGIQKESETREQLATGSDLIESSPIDRASPPIQPGRTGADSREREARPRRRFASGRSAGPSSTGPRIWSRRVLGPPSLSLPPFLLTFRRRPERTSPAFPQLLFEPGALRRNAEGPVSGQSATWEMQMEVATDRPAAAATRRYLACAGSCDRIRFSGMPRIGLGLARPRNRERAVRLMTVMTTPLGW